MYCVGCLGHMHCLAQIGFFEYVGKTQIRYCVTLDSTNKNTGQMKLCPLLRCVLSKPCPLIEIVCYVRTCPLFDHWLSVFK